MWSGRRASDPQAKWGRRLSGSLQHEQASLRFVHQGTPHRGLTWSAKILGVPLSFLLYNELRYLVYEWDNKRVVDVALQCHANRPGEQQGAMWYHQWWWWWWQLSWWINDDDYMVLTRPKMVTYWWWQWPQGGSNTIAMQCIVWRWWQLKEYHVVFRDSFTSSRICFSTKWRICSPSTRSFVFKLPSHSGTCVQKMGAI